MRILMVSLDFPPVAGGIAAHVYELSKALIERGHKVFVITRHRENGIKNSCIDGINVTAFKLKYMSPLYGRQINHFVQSNLDHIRPDIIHIHGMAPLEGYRITTPPLAYTNHTSGYLMRIQKYGRFKMFLLKRLFQKPSLFLAPSKELLATPFPISAEKRFIPNGVDAAKYKHNGDDRRSLRSELGFTDEDIVGILTRRLVPKNGMIYFARATKHIRQPNTKFIIIGDGDQKGAVEAELRQHIPGRFHMLGAKRHEEIISYYSAADFSVLPSLMEATSISGLEAMAAALPLVGTRVGGIPDLITPGYNGFLCDPADDGQLAEQINMLANEDLKKLGANSRKRVEEKFDWTQIARVTEEAYEGTICTKKC
jgi:glycosyltransferase involved in cell wall biosynthesis